MRSATAIAFGLLILFTSPAGAAPQVCDYTAGGAEEQAVEDASAALDAGCPCDGFATPGRYRGCVMQALRARVDAALLSKVCARTLKGLYLPNTCGHPADAVACVRIRSTITPGRRPCRIVRSESLCTPPTSGGWACTSDYSCQDALGKSYTPQDDGDCDQAD